MSRSRYNITPQRVIIEDSSYNPNTKKLKLKLKFITQYSFLRGEDSYLFDNIQRPVTQGEFPNIPFDIDNVENFLSTRIRLKKDNEIIRDISFEETYYHRRESSSDIEVDIVPNVLGLNGYEAQSRITERGFVTDASNMRILDNSVEVQVPAAGTLNWPKESPIIIYDYILGGDDGGDDGGEGRPGDDDGSLAGNPPSGGGGGGIDGNRDDSDNESSQPNPNPDSDRVGDDTSDIFFNGGGAIRE